MISSKDQISDHFHGDEFACPCCGVIQVNEFLLEGLEALREKIGEPIKILSGYRCEKHNEETGGEKNSFHCQGKAADVLLPGGFTLGGFYIVVDSMPYFGGIGVYPASAGQKSNFVHLDVRTTHARWSRINGHYFGVRQGLDYDKQEES